MIGYIIVPMIMLCEIEYVSVETTDEVQFFNDCP